MKHGLPQDPIEHTIDHLFRHESGKMVAVLSRMLGLERLDVAEDIVQDTLLQAMQTWRYKSIPENPSAWLYRVARNKVIDYLRREKKLRSILPQLGYFYSGEDENLADSYFQEDEIRDSQLRMIFACCHPSIPTEAQIALALKTLCGLSISEIARAFLVGEETIAKRIFRAREKLNSENVSLEHPPAHELPRRLDAVLHSLYLLFNEGYNSSHPDQLIREELCQEAMRLTYLLTRHKKTCLPRTYALMSLFCFQASRLQSRLDDQGQIIVLQDQDRSGWYRPLLEKGFYFLEQALGGEMDNSAYHLEAAIASLHASAVDFASTDWPSIYFLYSHLMELQPSPVVALNKAIAAMYALGPSMALEQALAIKDLDHYYLYHTVLGEIYHLLNRKEEARNSFLKAISLTRSKKELHLLKGKLEGC